MKCKTQKNSTRENFEWIIRNVGSAFVCIANKQLLFGSGSNLLVPYLIELMKMNVRYTRLELWNAEGAWARWVVEMNRARIAFLFVKYERSKRIKIILAISSPPKRSTSNAYDFQWCFVNSVQIFRWAWLMATVCFARTSPLMALGSPNTHTQTHVSTIIIIKRIQTTVWKFNLLLLSNRRWWIQNVPADCNYDENHHIFANYHICCSFRFRNTEASHKYFSIWF